MLKLLILIFLKSKSINITDFCFFICYVKKRKVEFKKLVSCTNTENPCVKSLKPERAYMLREILNPESKTLSNLT